jgi:hypothetical protein
MAAGSGRPPHHGPGERPARKRRPLVFVRTQRLPLLPVGSSSPQLLGVRLSNCGLDAAGRTLASLPSRS